MQSPDEILKSEIDAHVAQMKATLYRLRAINRAITHEADRDQIDASMLKAYEALENIQIVVKRN